MSQIIEESGMKFGELKEERLFWVEHSDIYRRVGEGIKTVEFIYLSEEENVLFVEAKQSCPNVANKDDSEEKRKKYEEYYTDVTDKFIDSVNLFATTVLGRNGQSDSVGESIVRKNTYAENGIKFVLVIAGAEESWLGGPKAELELRLFRYRKIWKADVVVLNKEMAIELGLVEGVNGISRVRFILDYMINEIYRIKALVVKWVRDRAGSICIVFVRSASQRRSW